ncbi:MAG: chemotaxis protein CheW [Rhodobacteraceae bacterium]|nr:chemotaxis protein CheW [Paracoccaceae bacterium]
MPTTVGVFRRGDLVLGFPAQNLAEVARVGAVLPMLECGPGCLGGIDLRGLHVPLLDLPCLVDHSTGRTRERLSRPELAAVLSVDGRMVALGVDRVVGLVRLPVTFDDDGALSGRGGDSLLRTTSTIHRGELLNMVDPEVLVAHPSVPTVADRRATTLALSRVQRRQMIQFDVGGAILAIPAVEINATLPRRAITRNALTGGICLGSIDLPTGTIPVVSAGALFGMGAASASDSSEIIVIPAQSGAPVGLAVDRILRIAEIDLARAVDIPRQANEGLLSARLVDTAGAALFVVDLPALRSDPRLLSLASVMAGHVSDRGATGRVSAGSGPTEAVENTAVERHRARYLLVDAGAPMAIPISSITRIVLAPETVIPVASPDPALLGLAVIDQEIMPLLMPRGAGFPRDETGRVLIVDTIGARAAIAVRQVLGVVTSAWRTRAGTDRNDAGGPEGSPRLIGAEVAAGGQASHGLHPVIDLAAEVDAIARTLPLARRTVPPT